VDALLRTEEAEALAERFGRSAVADESRRLLDGVREELRGGGSPETSVEGLLRGLERRLEETLAPGLDPVVNATGVVLHTNLGRAPLGEEALRALARVGGRYLNLEIDLETGRRGRRGGRLEDHVRAVTGAAAALVVNNNAAAVMLLLNTLAKGREAVVSRGELVEIGGSFRIPDVMAASGTRMVEVGTTNRTRPSDYESACGEATGLLLKVHPSNYRVVGFTQEVTLDELVEIGRRREVPVAMDMGSGVLERSGSAGMEDEPTVGEILATGVDAVTFSGDKALGGPQAGYVVGRPEVVEACRRNPLMRALRTGRLTMAAAEATWRAYRLGRQGELPTLRMLGASVEELRARAEAWRDRLAQEAPSLGVETMQGQGQVGGGTAPSGALPTVLLALEVPGMEAGEAADRLRRADPPVLVRVREGRVLVDPRTVLPGEEDSLLGALAALAG